MLKSNKTMKTDIVIMTLQELRKKKRISQAQLADMTGLRQETISALECGKRYPFRSTQELIEDVFRQPIDWINTYTEGIINN